MAAGLEVEELERVDGQPSDLAYAEGREDRQAVERALADADLDGEGGGGSILRSSCRLPAIRRASTPSQ